MTIKLNKTVFIFGVCLTFLGFTLPYVINHFLWEVMIGYNDEYIIILSHLQYSGSALGILLSILSFFYYAKPVKFFFDKILLNIFLAGASTLTILVLLELFLYYKYKDIQIGGWNTPSHYTFYRKYYKYNKWKFRDKERELENKANNYRILVLGDSFTFGAGVKYIKDLYPSVLEEKLNTGLPDSCRKFEVINTGLKGLSTEQEYNYLKDKGILFKPDFLVLGYFLNDAESQAIKVKRTHKVEKADLLPYPYGKFLKAYSFSYYFGQQRVKELMAKLTVTMKAGNSSYYDRIYSGDNLISYRKLFNEFMEYCRNKNLKVLVVFFPDIGMVKKENYPYLHIHSLVRKMVLENGMEFLDLLSPLKNSKIKHMKVSKFDGHPSEEVHHFAADLIYKRLVGMNSFPCINPN